MKWRVDIEYEDGSFTEPRRIAFQAIYDGEPYHGYDTKREALEAFCVGQVAIDELRKEMEAEQKKEEEKEVKVDMSEETRKRLEKFAPMSIIKIGWKAEAETSPYDGSITRVSFCEVVDGYPTKEEALIAFVEEQKGKKYGDNFLTPEGYTNGKERKIMERLEALEEAVHKPYIPFSVREAKDIVYKYQAKVEALGNRLTKIEGFAEKVEEIEKDLYKVSHLLGKDNSTDELKISKLDVASQKIDLLLTFLEAVCRNLGSDIKKMNNEPQTGKKDIEEVNEVLEAVDKGKADTFYEQVNKIGKNDYKECKANPFRCEKCGLEFKIVSQERALVEHCPSCGNKPKRIED